MLGFIPDYYKDKNLFLNAIRLKIMCDKAVNDYLSAIQLVPDRYKTREMCEKAMNIYLLVFNQE